MGGIAVFIVAAFIVAGCALAALLWAIRNGQFNDLKGAAERILIDDEDPSSANPDQAPTVCSNSCDEPASPRKR